MSISEYFVGQEVLFRITCYADPAKTELVDPDGLMLTINPPTEENTVLEGDDLTDEEGIGVWSALAVATEAGDWNWRWESTDPAIVSQGVFHVQAKNV